MKSDPSESGQNGFTRDYYGILNVPQDATAEDIKRAYRFHLKAFHPDKFEPGTDHARNAQKRTEEILEAYGVLSKPHFRAEYDRFRKYTSPLRDSKRAEVPAPLSSDTPRVGFRKLSDQFRARLLSSRKMSVTLVVLILAAVGVWLARTRSFRNSDTSQRQTTDTSATIPGIKSEPAPVSPQLSPSPAMITATQTPAVSSSPDPSGPSFQISELTTAKDSDPASETSIELRIGVQARSGVLVDPTEVKIQVFFYDIQENKELVLTNADVDYQWLSPHNWKDSTTEFLSVKYRRPEHSRDSADGAAPRRSIGNYFGYITRLYYDDQLQDVRADPNALLDNFPAPKIAPVEETGWDAFARGEYKRAAELFSKAADQGDSAAQEKLASLYETGTGVPLDHKKAVALYETAATQRSASALINLARMYYEGKGVARNQSKAAELLDKAAAQDSTDAMVLLGWLFTRGEGVQEDYSVAAAFYKKALEKGNRRAAVSLAILHEFGEGVEQSYEKAAQLYREPADLGDPEAQTNLANLYADGKGVAQDLSSAIELLERAAASNYPPALVNLGWFYDQGRGVKKDYQKAAELYRRAADHNYAPGQAYLASLYTKGKGVPLDYQKAKDLFQLALTHNDPNACNDFAWFLATCPDASHRNGKEAVKYATKACEGAKWKNANFIGTLAAAYAEAGDFSKAVDYATRSLKMTSLERNQRREMKQCLALFRRHRACRDGDFSEVSLATDQISGPGSLAAARFRINVDTATADELNENAWRLATSPKSSERDGKLAVTYAQKACEISKWGDAHFIATLATAFAEAGQFDSALRYARNALAIERKVSGTGPANFRQRSQMEVFIELFKSKKAYRDETR